MSELDNVKVGDTFGTGENIIKINQTLLDELKQFEAETGKKSIYEGEITHDVVLWIADKRNKDLTKLEKENAELKKELDEVKEKLAQIKLILE